MEEKKPIMIHVSQSYSDDFEEDQAIRFGNIANMRTAYDCEDEIERIAVKTLQEIANFDTFKRDFETHCEDMRDLAISALDRIRDLSQCRASALANIKEHD